MAKKYTKSEKAQFLSAFHQRTEGASAFSRRAGVSFGSLYRWQKDSGLGFVEVSPAVEPAVKAGVRVVVGDTVVHFEGLPPVDYVVELLESLQHLRTC